MKLDNLIEMAIEKELSIGNEKKEETVFDNIFFCVHKIHIVIHNAAH